MHLQGVEEEEALDKGKFSMFGTLSLEGYGVSLLDYCECYAPAVLSEVGWGGEGLPNFGLKAVTLTPPLYLILLPHSTHNINLPPTNPTPCPYYLPCTKSANFRRIPLSIFTSKQLLEASYYLYSKDTVYPPINSTLSVATYNIFDRVETC